MGYGKNLVSATFEHALCSLYVGVAVLSAPQDSLQIRLLFWFCWFFFVCLGVVAVFLCHMLHGNSGMWVWWHVEFVQKSNVPTGRAMQSGAITHFLVDVVISVCIW
jgi:hypothetical protein